MMQEQRQGERESTRLSKGQKGQEGGKEREKGSRGKKRGGSKESSKGIESSEKRSRKKTEERVVLSLKELTCLSLSLNFLINEQSGLSCILHGKC